MKHCKVQAAQRLLHAQLAMALLMRGWLLAVQDALDAWHVVV